MPVTTSRNYHSRLMAQIGPAGPGAAPVLGWSERPAYHGDRLRENVASVTPECAHRIDPRQERR